jgi:hypothetical protein
MKKHIVVGSALLLTLGTAVASTFMYGDDRSQPALNADSFASEMQVQSELTPELIALWKASAASADSIAPKVPI